MHKGRLEAFSDGVLAIILTIMVLELKVPHGESIESLTPILPVLMSYAVSFIYIGIYWNNHHHLFQATREVNGGIMWANLHLLFWLSLFPFITAWSSETHFATIPVALYGVVLLMAGTAYYILSRLLIKVHGRESLISKAVGTDTKGVVSLVVYVTAIGVAFLSPTVSCLLYVSVAIMWLVPDRRIERQITQHPSQ